MMRTFVMLVHSAGAGSEICDNGDITLTVSFPNCSKSISASQIATWHSMEGKRM